MRLRFRRDVLCLCDYDLTLFRSKCPEFVSNAFNLIIERSLLVKVSHFICVSLIFEVVSLL